MVKRADRARGNADAQAEGAYLQPAQQADDAQPDEADALRAAFVTFHAGTPTRSAMTDNDRAAMAWVNDRLAVCLAKWAYHDDHDAPAAVTTLRTAVDRYFAACSGIVRLELVGGGSIESPAIESSAARTAITRTGDEVLAQIDAAIQAVRDRAARVRAEARELAERVRYWMGDAAIRAHVLAVLAVEEMAAQRGLRSAHYNSNVLDSLRVMLAFLAAEQQDRIPALPVAGGRWWSWFPLAVGILVETEPVSAEALRIVAAGGADALAAQLEVAAHMDTIAKVRDGGTQ